MRCLVAFRSAWFAVALVFPLAALAETPAAIPDAPDAVEVVCVRDCDGRDCGPDGCGGICGLCDEGEVCSDGGTCTASPCGDVTFEGCCQGASTLVYCEEGELVTLDCAEEGAWPPFCGWDGESGYYGCGLAGAGSGDPDLPYSCDPDCEPDCQDRECGPDGCGGSCGECADGQYCDGAGTCSDSDCGDLSFEGCCGQDGALHWCEGNKAQSIGCLPEEGRCGWSDLDGFYDCGTPGLADPSGETPYSCEPGCEPACEGLDCGPDGCGGVCGQCGDGQYCDEAGACAESDCGDITDVGCCEPDGTLKYCIDGVLETVECATDGIPACGWSAEAGYYDCGTDGLKDPGGVHPYSCAGSCQPDCDDRECGPDGCGGVCGQCGPGLVCSAEGTCGGAPPPEGIAEQVLPDPGGEATATPEAAGDATGPADAPPDSAGGTETGSSGGGGGGCTAGGAGAALPSMASPAALFLLACVLLRSRSRRLAMRKMGIPFAFALSFVLPGCEVASPEEAAPDEPAAVEEDDDVGSVESAASPTSHSIQLIQKGAFGQSMFFKPTKVLWGLVKNPGDPWTDPKEVAIPYYVTGTKANKAVKLSIPKAKLKEGYIVAYKLKLDRNHPYSSMTTLTTERFIKQPLSVTSGRMAVLPLTATAGYTGGFYDWNYQIRVWDAAGDQCSYFYGKPISYFWGLTTVTQDQYVKDGPAIGYDFPWYDNVGSPSLDGFDDGFVFSHNGGYKGYYGASEAIVWVPSGWKVLFKTRFAKYWDKQVVETPDTKAFYFDPWEGGGPKCM